MVSMTRSRSTQQKCLADRNKFSAPIASQDQVQFQVWPHWRRTFSDESSGNISRHGGRPVHQHAALGAGQRIARVAQGGDGPLRVRHGVARSGRFLPDVAALLLGQQPGHRRPPAVGPEEQFFQRHSQSFFSVHLVPWSLPFTFVFAFGHGYSLVNRFFTRFPLPSYQQWRFVWLWTL